MSVVQSTSLFPELVKPYLFAHQGGEALAPTNTMAAFALADSIGGSDFLDIDVHMTRDGHLVGIHDPTVDRTTNAQGRVDSYTLEEIQQLDAGYWFRDVQGEYSYRGKGIKIPSLEEFFEVYAQKYYLHFEIKDAYPKNASSQIEAKLKEFTLLSSTQTNRCPHGSMLIRHANNTPLVTNHKAHSSSYGRVLGEWRIIVNLQMEPLTLVVGLITLPTQDGTKDLPNQV